MQKRTKKIILFSSITALILFLIIWIIWGNTAITVSRYTIESDRIPESFQGFRIAQISDLHNTQFGENNRDLLENLKNIAPDIIVITGDLVDSRNTDIDIALNFAGEAVKIAPTYYVTGNHEARISQYPQLEKGLTDAGVTVLKDDIRLLEREGETIRLAGLTDTDFRENVSSEIWTDVIENLPESQYYTVMLAHNPALFPIFTQCQIDLALCGHVHGGQFRIPFLGGVYGPGQGLFPQWDAGLYTENSTNMVLSRGLGNSLFPFRVNNPPEIVVVELSCP